MKVKQPRRWKKHTVQKQGEISNRFSGRILWASSCWAASAHSLPGHFRRQRNTSELVPHHIRFRFSKGG